VLGPLLYLLYTTDLPTTNNTTIATFGDDTTLLATNSDPGLASNNFNTILIFYKNGVTNGKSK
jgi:hypothetical protein